MTKFPVKKNDILLIAVFLLIPLLIVIYQNLLERDPGKEAVISVGGELWGSLPLNREEEVVIQQEHGVNVVLIRDHTARIIRADCRDGICMEYRPISRASERIVCLPNRVIVEIRGKGENGVDTISE